MVCAWCIALIAVCAIALVVKVTNAQPGERTKRNQVIRYICSYRGEKRNENIGVGCSVCHRKSWNATLTCKRQHPVENFELSEKLPAYLGSGHLGPVISCILQSAQRGRTSLEYHSHCTSWISSQWTTSYLLLLRNQKRRVISAKVYLLQLVLPSLLHQLQLFPLYLG